MTNDVTADINKLMEDASATAALYLRRAIAIVDGEARIYSRETLPPDLVGLLVQTMAMDFHTAMMKTALQDLRTELGFIAGALSEIDNTLATFESLKS